MTCFRDKNLFLIFYLQKNLCDLYLNMLKNKWYSPVAQLVEQVAVNHWVGGSSPSRGATKNFKFFLSFSFILKKLNPYLVIRNFFLVLFLKHAIKKYKNKVNNDCKAKGTN